MQSVDALGRRAPAEGAEVQPFDRGHDLAAITVPIPVVRGTDPQHPPEVSDVFRRYVDHCVVRETDAAQFASALAELADRIGWTP